MRDKQQYATKKHAPAAKGVAFTYELDSDAKEVYLAGDFNNWDERTHRMTRRGRRFHKSVHLEPGEYQYKFVVDGEWRTDPAAPSQVPNPFGTLNSVIRVSGKS
jgi:1,4-alpha-glucan branching enzyme